ncbi:MAG: hypothetical protein L7F78_14705 [Syntrophales bacterium LBB04]|nr:hypothetical protein [Syntrophales bacterium LBB04]
MNKEFIILSTVVLAVLLIILLGVKPAQCCTTYGKMICHCAERGLVCLCPIFSCPQCAGDNDLQDEDESTDIIFHLYSRAIHFPSVLIETEKLTKPRPVYLKVPEIPPESFSRPKAV